MSLCYPGRISTHWQYRKWTSASPETEQWPNVHVVHYPSITVQDLYDHVHLSKTAVPLFTKTLKDVTLNQRGTLNRRSKTKTSNTPTTERYLPGPANSMLRSAYQPRFTQQHRPSTPQNRLQLYPVSTEQPQDCDTSVLTTTTTTAAAGTDPSRQTVLFWGGQRRNRPCPQWIESHPGHAEYIMFSSYGPQSWSMVMTVSGSLTKMSTS